MEWEQFRAVSSTRLRATIVPTQMAKMPFAEHDNMGKTFPPHRTNRSFNIQNIPQHPCPAGRQTLPRLPIVFGRGEPVARDIDATGHEHIIAVFVECREDTQD